MPAAAAIPAAIGGVGSLVSGIIGSNAAGNAGKTLFNAGQQVAGQIGTAGSTAASGVSNAVTAGQNRISNAQQDVGGSVYNAQQMMHGAMTGANQNLSDVFGLQSANLNPYLAAGNQGISTLQQMMQPGGYLTQQFTAPTAQDVQNTPGYQFQLQQGQQALMRSAAAAGQVGSGGTAKALDQYTQGLASTYYQNAYNNALTAFQTNRQNTMSSIGALMGAGQFGTSQYNQAAQNYGNLTSANLMNTGQYMGSTGLQGSEFNAGLSQYAAGLGVQGAGMAGQFDLNSAIAAGQAYMQGAGGMAAGQMGSANAWQNAIYGMAGAGMYGANALMNPGGGASPWATGTYNPTSGDYNYNPYNPGGPK